MKCNISTTRNQVDETYRKIWKIKLKDLPDSYKKIFIDSCLQKIVDE